MPHLSQPAGTMAGCKQIIRQDLQVRLSLLNPVYAVFLLVIVVPKAIEIRSGSLRANATITLAAVWPTNTLARSGRGSGSIREQGIRS